MYTIYQITNSLNGKRYIGKTLKKKPASRWEEHKKFSRLGSDTHFHKALRKWGTEVFFFEILAWGDNNADSSVAEILLIEFFKPEYNMTLGGDGTVGSPRPKSDNWKLQHSEDMLGKNNPMFGVNRPDDWRNGHSQRMKEFYKENPEKRPVGKNNGMFGKHQSEHMKEVLAEKNTKTTRITKEEWASLLDKFKSKQDIANSLGLSFNAVARALKLHNLFIDRRNRT